MECTFGGACANHRNVVRHASHNPGPAAHDPCAPSSWKDNRHVSCIGGETPWVQVSAVVLWFGPTPERAANEHGAVVELFERERAALHTEHRLDEGFQTIRDYQHQGLGLQ